MPPTVLVCDCVPSGAGGNLEEETGANHNYLTALQGRALEAGGTRVARLKHASYLEQRC